jgi:hypothetical protein
MQVYIMVPTDCGASICSDCRVECCGDSFCEYCYGYHATHSCDPLTKVVPIAVVVKIFQQQPSSPSRKLLRYSPP